MPDSTVDTGGALGVAVAVLGLRALLAAFPYTLPRSENIGLHFPVLMFTMAASIAAGILFGLAGWGCSRNTMAIDHGRLGLWSDHRLHGN